MLQPLKQESPIEVTLPGTSMTARFVQPEKVLCRIAVRLVGSVTLVKLAQSAKAICPRVVTLFGIPALVSEQERKAESPMTRNPSGKITLES